MGYDASKYKRAGNYLRKADLRKSGEQAFTIAEVTEADSLPSMKGDVYKVLELGFTDGHKFTLSAEVNRGRVEAMFGSDTDAWIGRRLCIYFSRDIPNPKGGEPGGLRVKEADEDVVDEDVSFDVNDLEDVEDEDEPAPAPPPRPVARPAAVAATPAVAAGARRAGGKV